MYLTILQLLFCGLRSLNEQKYSKEKGAKNLLKNGPRNGKMWAFYQFPGLLALLLEVSYVKKII